VPRFAGSHLADALLREGSRGRVKLVESEELHAIAALPSGGDNLVFRGRLTSRELPPLPRDPQSGLYEVGIWEVS
jgi:hypothetical protein